MWTSVSVCEYDALRWRPFQGVSPPHAHQDPDQDKYDDDDDEEEYEEDDHDDGLLIMQTAIFLRQDIDFWHLRQALWVCNIQILLDSALFAFNHIITADITTM